MMVASVVFVAIVAAESTIQSKLGWRVNLIASFAELLVPSHAVSNDGGGDMDGRGCDGGDGGVGNVGNDGGHSGGDGGRGPVDTTLIGTAIFAGKIFCWFVVEDVVQFPLMLLLSLVLMFVWRVYRRTPHEHCIRDTRRIVSIRVRNSDRKGCGEEKKEAEEKEGEEEDEIGINWVKTEIYANPQPQSHYLLADAIMWANKLHTNLVL